MVDGATFKFDNLNKPDAPSFHMAAGDTEKNVVPSGKPTPLWLEPGLVFQTSTVRSPEDKYTKIAV